MAEPITMDQHGCARCGADIHPQITYQPLGHMMDLGDGRMWSHWALCPTTGEPILLLDVPEGTEPPTVRALRIATEALAVIGDAREIARMADGFGGFAGAELRTRISIAREALAEIDAVG